MPKIISLRFQVKGKVQGVFFRNYAVDTAVALRLVGYIYNGLDGCVYGEAQGEEANISLFKDWLKNKGSPQSRIDDASFKEEEMERLSYSGFEKKHGKHSPPDNDR